MRKNTLKQVKDLIKSLGRTDLKVKTKWTDDTNYYVITCTGEDIRYEVTCSKTTGILSVRTCEGSRLTWNEMQMLLSLDKVLERLRYQHD